MHVVKECFIPFQVSFVLQKDSPYKQRIDEVLLRMQEAGLINRYYNEELDKVANVIDPTSSEYDIQPLTLGHMKGLFALTSLLWTIAICAFFKEVFQNKKKRWFFTDSAAR